MDQRILRAYSPLLNAQIHIATGQTFLYKIEKEFVKTGTTKDGEDKGYWKSKPAKLVTSQFEIEEYLNGLAEEGDMHDDQDPGSTFYYMTTKEPNNEALKNLFDRIRGTPRATLDTNINVTFSLKDLASRREALKTPSKIIDLPNKEVGHE